MPLNSEGKDDIALWENMLTADEINRILASPEWLKTSDAGIGNGDSATVDKDIRRTQVGWYHPDNTNQDIWNKISYSVSKVNSQFFRFNLTGLYEPAQLSLYTQNNTGHYEWHTDGSLSATQGVPRKLSMVLSLSDPSDYEGGELQVMRSAKTEHLELKKGRAWFFPAWMLHRVTPVTRGIRRTLVLWIGGPSFY